MFHGVVVNLIEKPKHGHAITPTMLEINSGVTVLVHNERMVLVEPSIARIAVQELRRQDIGIVRVGVVESHAVESRVDYAKSFVVSQRL
jgi:hypothetical protein